MRNILAIALIAIFTLNSVAQSDQQLVDRYDKMYAAEKYEKALEAAQTICDRYPQTASWHFKAGALLARLGQLDEAITHLKACAQNKYTGIASFDNNSDLDSLRDRDDFKSILESVRTNAETRINEFKEEAYKHNPKSYFPDANIKKPMLIIALHGTGMDGQSMYDAILPAAQKHDAVLICPDALRPAGNGFSWTYRDESVWFVHHLIDEAITEHDADPDRVILIGFSQGANIILNMGQMEPEKFLAVVPICGHYEAQNAEADYAPVPFYLISGARDPWKKTYVNARKDFLAKGGVVESRLLAGKGHQLPSGVAGTKEYSKAIIWALKQLDTD